MLAIFCRRSLRRVTPEDCCIFAAQQIWSRENPVLVRSCSTSVCENASEKTFTVSSYLINSCGLSSKDAISASKKLCSIKSPEKPDAVLKLLREYGFTDSHHIPRLITRWPAVLTASPNKTLLPKLGFFRSIGVPLPVLAHKLSLCPSVLTRSLENSIIPLYNALKSLLGSDDRVVLVFSRSPKIFGYCSEGINVNISLLRDRGVPESSIVSLFTYQPSLLALSKEKLSSYVDRAVEIGFDISKNGFVNAMRVFACMTESTLEQKMEVFRRCGWTEPNIVAGFLKNPLCMNLSEKKIVATMDFLVNELGCKLAAIVDCPALLSYSLEKRIKPRALVSWILDEKGLKNMTGVTGLLVLSEEKFLNRYIVKYENDIPELMDIYRGKLSPLEMGFSQKRNARLQGMNDSSCKLLSLKYSSCK